MGGVDLQNLERIKNLLLQNNINSKNKNLILIETELEKFLLAEIKLLIIEIGNVQYEDVIMLKKRLKIFNDSFSGIVIFES